jgi:hypothetical protein
VVYSPAVSCKFEKNQKHAYELDASDNPHVNLPIMITYAKCKVNPKIPIYDDFQVEDA